MMAKRGGSHTSPASKQYCKYKVAKRGGPTPALHQSNITKLIIYLITKMSLASFEPLTHWIEVVVYGQVFSLS